MGKGQNSEEKSIRNPNSTTTEKAQVKENKSGNGFWIFPSFPVPVLKQSVRTGSEQGGSWKDGKVTEALKAIVDKTGWRKVNSNLKDRNSGCANWYGP